MFQKKLKKNLSLEKEILNGGMIPNILTGIITAFLIILTVIIKENKILNVIVYSAIILCVLQFIVAPLTNKIITSKISDDLEWFYNYESSERERTNLLKNLLSIPEKIGLEVFSVFFIGILILIFLCAKTDCIDKKTVLIAIFSGLLGAYAGLVFAYSKTQQICSNHACKIVEKGISKIEIKNKHTFGAPSARITCYHIFLPIIIINFFFFVLIYNFKQNDIEYSKILVKIAVISVINLIIYCILSTLLFSRMMKSINLTKQILENTNRDNLNKIKHFPTDLSNEFMYNIYLINTISDILQKILKVTNDISMEVVQSSNELSVISKETSVTSLEQNSGIKELLAAMDESDSLAKNISTKSGEVSLIAKKNTENIGEGYEILKKNMQKLSEIENATQITLEGIETLTQKISGISDIAGIINSIADQTNIIAFNAELEASRVENSGQNFHNVATEIRRLTNNTIQSTNEIKEKISEIQHSSEKLLLSSKNGSKKIAEENEIIAELYKNFKNLQDSSKASEVSSEEIKKIIEQQTVSFEQIVGTLRQLGETVESFSISTQNINKFAENLCELSSELNEIQSDSENNVENA